MGVSWQNADEALQGAVEILFGNPTTRSVGIGQHGDGYGFHVIRNVAQVLPLAAASVATPADINNVPLTIVDRYQDIGFHVRLPFSGPGTSLWARSGVLFAFKMATQRCSLTTM